MAKITKDAVDRLRRGERDGFIWDSEVRGFGVRVTTNGVKSFVLQYRPPPGGRTTPARRYTIGVFGSPWTADTARKRAKTLLVEIGEGRDPLTIKRGDREAPTVADLCALYLDAMEKGKVRNRKGSPKSPSTVASDRGRIERHIKPLLGKRRVRELTRDDIQRFHDDVADGTKIKADVKTGKRGRAIVTGGAGTAARTTGLLGGILSFAVARRDIEANPARGVKRTPDQKVVAYLSPAQFRALGSALASAESDWTEYEEAHAAWLAAGREGKAPTMPRDAASPTAVAAVRLLILTGCRKSEILTLKWDHVDFERRLLRLPTSKTGQKDIRLGAPALAVLASLSPLKGNPYVLPGEKKGHHLVGLPRAWARLCKRAKIGKVRLHDLRHSFASVAAGAGDSLLMIGALLGHKNTATTSRYAHLADDPMREAADRVSNTIDAMLSAAPVAEVVSINRKRPG